MALQASLGQRLGLRTHLHPALRLALRFLELPALELAAAVRREAEGNPLVELEEGDELLPLPPLLARRERAALGWEFERAREPAAREPWRDRLRREVALLLPDPAARPRAEILLGALDDRGYLGLPLEDVQAQFGGTMDEWSAALAAIQRLDPPGLGARDLPEALLLQLRARGRGEGALARLLESAPEWVAHGKWGQLQRRFRLPAEELDALRSELSSLSPCPGRSVANDEEVRYIYPDLNVERIGGEWEITLNDRAVPRVLVTEYLPGEPFPEAAAAYLRGCRRSGEWLRTAVERRRGTILSVMRCIADEQAGFWEQGVSALKPLRLVDVARRLQLSESTVARVTSSKYVQTPRGLYSLKFFFSGGVRTIDGTTVSARALRDRVGRMIAAEDRNRPLSDDAIANALAAEGIRIARRTVAKYRQGLRLDTAAGRARRAVRLAP